jgi:diguanylate cyclase (GGDEF)-like protein
MRLLGAFVITIACLAVLLACLVLVGWIGGIDTLKSIRPDFSTMKPNTAIAVGALGISLLLERWSKSRPVATAAAIFTLAIALVTLAEDAFDWDAGIDQFFFRDNASASAPGRPAAATSVMIMFLSVALLVAHRPALPWLKTSAALCTTLIAWAALTSYVFGPQALREMPAFSSVALPTAAVLLALGIGVLAAEPISWPVRTAVSSGIGGVICRWLLPAAMLAPPTLGWLLSREGKMDVFPAQFDWAVYSAVSTFGSVWLIMMLAHRITLIDAERSAATELSRHDSLTGLANRRAFDACLHENFGLSRRHRHPLSLLLVDVDRFKRYNDSFGHPAGDELLKSVGARLSSIARETDLVARVGGEEFAVILPETDSTGAQVLAERARLEVERTAGFLRQVTVSIGVATLSPDMATPFRLIQESDRALYRAKRAGRNRVSSNESLPAEFKSETT